MKTQIKEPEDYIPGTINRDIKLPFVVENYSTQDLFESAFTSSIDLVNEEHEILANRFWPFYDGTRRDTIKEFVAQIVANLQANGITLNYSRESLLPTAETVNDSFYRIYRELPHVEDDFTLLVTVRNYLRAHPINPETVKFVG